MSKITHSFSVGASLKNGKVIAFLLKFRFTDNSELLTAWGLNQIPILLRILLEYQQLLVQEEVKLDPDSIEKTIRGEAPALSKYETENLPIQSVVESVSGNIRADRILDIKIQRANTEDQEIISIKPNQCEWLIGFTANTLNEFDEDGALILPQGQAQ